jgi:predicted dehydrogenase
MIKTKLKTVLIGCGNVGANYATDPVMARYYPYATHAQVLAVHPYYAWDAVVDLSDKALEIVRCQWKISLATHNIQELPEAFQPDVAIIATPPEERIQILEQLPTLQAVLVEKPLGITLDEGQDFLDYCYQHEILVQVNLWRRADEMFRELAKGYLHELIGCPQAVFGIYGNGLVNNGLHMVDFIRMLFGEIEAVQTMRDVVPYHNGPISDDINVPFHLRLSNGVVVSMQPVNFEYYRENSLDIWGEKARLAIMQEGLGIFLYPQRENRAIQNEREVASDQLTMLKTTVGEAFYHMYSNLADTMYGESTLWSSGEVALQSTNVIDAIRKSVQGNGAIIELT